MAQPGTAPLELKTWEEFVAGDFMPKLNGDQQGELVKFFKDMGFQEPTDAQEVALPDVEPDIAKIVVTPKPLMKAAARAAIKAAQHRHLLRRIADVRRANAVQVATPVHAGGGHLQITAGARAHAAALGQDPTAVALAAPILAGKKEVDIKAIMGRAWPCSRATRRRCRRGS